jgi:hypothetical protein
MPRRDRILIAAARVAAALALAALTAGCDDTGAVDGSRGPCASGAADCGPVTGADGACDRLVACGALPLDADDGFDWGRCVDQIEALTDDRARLVVACIGASTCDDLRTAGSPEAPYGGIYCLALGDR